MSTEPHKGGNTLLIVFVILWLGVLTFLAITPAGQALTQQPAGAEQSTRQVLCADALERRQAAEKALTTGLAGDSSNEVRSWLAAQKTAQLQLERANADKGFYCR